MSKDDSFGYEVSVVPDYAFSQMAVRIEKSKVVMWYKGDTRQLVKDGAEMSGTQFVKALYRELLGRPAWLTTPSCWSRAEWTKRG
jgi:hypothetical protein